MALGTTIKVIQDIMRKDMGVDGDAQRIGQLSWMIFLKILDDHERELESQNSTYCSPIPTSLRWRNWAVSREFTGDDLLNFVNNELFKKLKTLAMEEVNHPLSAVIRSVFDDAFNYMKSGSLIRQVLDKINDDIHFTGAKERHLFGDIYEKILKDLQSAGNAGEFYTPRAVTEFVIDVIDPRLGEKILDPACGTGGFLTCAIEHIRDKYVRNASDEKILQESLLGIEKKSLPHLLCVTNMLLHGINVPSQIRRTNALALYGAEYDKEDQVDVIVTNPPFGGQEEDNVDASFPEHLRSKETADLFFLLIFSFLKEGGRAAIVLPDGFLFSEGVKTRIREKLLEECNLHTIVRLPKGVFNPYTDITTNILFFTKGTPTKEIWYYDHPYPPSYKSYSKSKPIRREEFDQEVQWWNTREESSHSWKVSIEEIKTNNYNLDIKNPYIKAHQLDFETLLTHYDGTFDEIESLSLRLKHRLKSSLKNSYDIKQDMLFENFKLFTGTGNGVQKLRELVLQFAMQGRLVPQEGEDAQLLYNQIQARKHRVMKQGIVTQPYLHLSTEGSHEPVSEQKKCPFEIPKHWKWVRLGDIGQIVGGGTPDTSNPDYFAENGIPWVTPADLYQLKSKFITRGKRDISELGLQKSSARLLPKGSVLFSSRAPIGYVAIAANDISTNQGFKSCIPYIMEMNEFIYYFLMYASKEIERNAPGTTFKEVSGKIVQRIMFPLPPLVEQKRIVVEIDFFLDLLNELEQKMEILQRNRDLLIEVIDKVILRDVVAV